MGPNFLKVNTYCGAPCQIVFFLSLFQETYPGRSHPRAMESAAEKRSDLKDVETSSFTLRRLPPFVSRKDSPFLRHRGTSDPLFLDETDACSLLERKGEASDISRFLTEAFSSNQFSVGFSSLRVRESIFLRAGSSGIQSSRACQRRAHFFPHSEKRILSRPLPGCSKNSLSPLFH